MIHDYNKTIETIILPKIFCNYAIFGNAFKNCAGIEVGENLGW